LAAAPWSFGLLPSVLAAGGVQIETVSHVGTALDERLTLTLTAGQAHELVVQLESAML